MINYPNIDPVAISIPIPGFWGDALNIHWYGLAYVIGAYLIYLRMVATRDNFEIKAKSRWPLDSEAPYMKGPGLIL